MNFSEWTVRFRFSFHFTRVLKSCSLSSQRNVQPKNTFLGISSIPASSSLIRFVKRITMDNVSLGNFLKRCSFSVGLSWVTDTLAIRVRIWIARFSRAIVDESARHFRPTMSHTFEMITERSLLSSFLAPLISTLYFPTDCELRLWLSSETTQRGICFLYLCGLTSCADKNPLSQIATIFSQF